MNLNNQDTRSALRSITSDRATRRQSTSGNVETLFSVRQRPPGQMPLFEVPGWSVKADPVGESPNQASRKRKRNSEDSTGSEVNLDRLMNKLKRKPDKEHKASSSANKKQKAHEDKKNSISLPKALKGAEKRSTDVQRPPPKKKAKTKHLVESKSSDDSPLPSPQESAGLTEMQKQMRDSLNGARFRSTTSSCCCSSTNMSG